MATMNDEVFWATIEAAWQGVEGASDLRAALLDDARREDAAFALEPLVDEMVQALRPTLMAMERAALLAFDRHLERAMWTIDRADIQEVTDGSDDGFEYARAFIVACGREYHSLVDARPSCAVCDVECGSFAWCAVEVLEERFGAGAWTQSGISRASCSNAEGWPPD